MASRPDQLGSLIAAMMAQGGGAPQGPSPQSRQHAVGVAQKQDSTLNARVVDVADSLFAISGANEFLSDFGALVEKYADTPFVKEHIVGGDVGRMMGPGAGKHDAAVKASELVANEAGVGGAFASGYNNGVLQFTNNDTEYAQATFAPGGGYRGPNEDRVVATAQRADDLRASRTAKNDARFNATRGERLQDRTSQVNAFHAKEQAGKVGSTVGGKYLGRLFATLSSKLGPN